MGLRKDRCEWLTAVYVSTLVLSNVLSVKLITISKLIVPGGVFCYAITYLMSDVVGELYGKEQAQKMLKYGLVCQVICSALIGLTVLLPSANAQGEIINTVLKSNVWFTLAGLIAYIISQTIDVALFHRIREKLIDKGKGWKWVWNNVSTIISQAVDTVIYLVISFGIGMGYLWSAEQGAVLLQMMLSQFIVKVVLAIADTPIFYILTRRRGK